jgi:hypothetical protein
MPAHQFHHPDPIAGAAGLGVGGRDGLDRGGAGFQPVQERAEFLIGQPVIVLDEIDAAQRQPLGQLGQRGDRQTLRFQRGAGQRAFPNPR